MAQPSQASGNGHLKPFLCFGCFLCFSSPNRPLEFQVGASESRFKRLTVVWLEHSSPIEFHLSRSTSIKSVLKFCH